MRQISKHDVNKLSVAKLKAMLPFEVVADGKIIFVACDVNKLEETHKASHDVNKLNPKPKAAYDVNKPRLSSWELKYGKSLMHAGTER